MDQAIAMVSVVRFTAIKTDDENDGAGRFC